MFNCEICGESVKLVTSCSLFQRNLYTCKNCYDTLMTNNNIIYSVRKKNEIGLKSKIYNNIRSGIIKI